MSTLYVTEHDVRLELEYQRILVTRRDEVLMAVPIARLGEVVLVGRVGATTPALHMLLDAGIPVALITRSGRLRGRLVPPVAKNIPLRHAQYRRANDPAFCLALSRRIVAGKLGNTLSLARRLRRAHPDLEPGAVERIERALSRLPRATTLAALRGMEGLAARAYFRLYRGALREPFRFERRSRRPPRDPANALLSFGYTLLTQNLMTACEIVGLDPYDGFFHADKYGRPALALDLVEAFRGPIVDSVVRRVINQGIIRPSHFSHGSDGGVYLTRPGLRRFFEQYAHRIHTEFYHRGIKRRLSYLKLFEVQARWLAKYVLGELDSYRPFRIR